jgi:hypothetical protein
MVKKKSVYTTTFRFFFFSYFWLRLRSCLPHAHKRLLHGKKWEGEIVANRRISFFMHIKYRSFLRFIDWWCTSHSYPFDTNYPFSSCFFFFWLMYIYIIIYEYISYYFFSFFFSFFFLFFLYNVMITRTEKCVCLWEEERWQEKK